MKHLQFRQECWVLFVTEEVRFLAAGGKLGLCGTVERGSSNIKIM